MSAGERPVDRRLTLALLVLILLAASAFRFIGLDNFPSPRGATPPGLEHDEVAHWLINQDILAGNHAIYFTEAYGHEALYHYLQAAFGALVGDHALALRLPSAYFGIILVAVSYALGRRLYGVRVGLWSAAFVAVLFWPVFYSRLALRAISLPVLSGLAAYWWWRMPVKELGGRGTGKQGIEGAGWDERENGGEGGRGSKSRRSVDGGRLRPYLPALLAGAFAGLSLHTYMAARAVPIFFALFTIYLLIFHRAMIRRQWRQLALFWLTMALLAAPLAIFLLTNPGAEVRIAEVDAPLRALRSGDVRLVLENGVRIAAMFGVAGDPLWRQNIAGRPLFDPLMALLFYAGVALSLWRWRDSRQAFLVLWLVASAIPSLVTIDAPSSIRIINLLPVLMLFPLVFIHTLPNLSTAWEKLSPVLVTRMITWGLGGLLLLSTWSTITGLWRIWPADDEVRFVWQAALTEAAAYLDASAGEGAVAVGGWTPDTMDPPTMELALRRDDLSLRYFDPLQSLILPVGAATQAIRVVTPSALPLHPHLRQLVVQWEQTRDEFVLYDIPAGPKVTPEHEAGIDFGAELRLLGYDLLDDCVLGAPCTLATYWQATAAGSGPRRFFLHAVDGEGEIVAQDDRLGAPAEHWQPGDIVIQLLAVAEATPELWLGVYDPTDGRRLPTESGDEFTVIGGSLGE